MRVAPGNNAKATASFLPEAHAHAIADVEPFDFNTFVIEHDAAVGEHSIDVNQDQFDRLALLGYGHDALLGRMNCFASFAMVRSRKLCRL